jgi:hypothetical protein
MTALTTSEATQLLPGKTFDWILTDMHRIESGKEAPAAGLDFIREARKLGVTTPIIVHCGRGSMIRYGDKAKAAGASEVTDSPTQVLALLMA